MNKIDKYIESQRIENHKFKTKKAALLNSIIKVIGECDGDIYINGLLKLTYE